MTLKRRRIYGLITIALSTIGLGMFMYIVAFAGIALDENMSFVEYFEIMGMLEWMVLLVFILLFFLSIVNYLSIKDN